MTTAAFTAWDQLVADLNEYVQEVHFAEAAQAEEFNGWVQLGGDTSRPVTDFNLEVHFQSDLIDSYEEDAALLGAESSECVFPAVLPEVAERTAQAWNRFRAIIRGEAA
jgi:hypothetical protein